MSLSTNAETLSAADRMFIFVGSLIPSPTLDKDAEGFVLLKYRVIERTYGNYDADEIEFLASYDYDKLKFTQYEHCLLFLSLDKRINTFVKWVIPVYNVFQTIEGRWAAGAFWWEYISDFQTSIRPRRLYFKDKVRFDLSGMSKEQIDHWYPAKYYRQSDGFAFPVFGNYTDELFEINKSGFLKSYFPSEIKFLEKLQIDNAISGWKKAGILRHLPSAKISAARRKLLRGRHKSLNEVIAYFPGVIYWFDTELENLNDPYAAFVKNLSEISHGAFQPTDISDNFSTTPQSGVTLQFTWNNKSYASKFRIQDDWIDTDVLDFIKEVVSENDPGGQFYQLEENGQGGIVIFLTPQQHEYLKANELVWFSNDE